MKENRKENKVSKKEINKLKENKKINVIIDCDTGIDDSLALMYILKSNKFNVLGITTITGNVDAEMAARNTYGILKRFNRTDIPIIVGNKKPLKKEYIVANETHGIDGLGLTNISQDSVTDNIKFQNTSYWDFYASELSKAYKNNYKINILCLGPLTNLRYVLKTSIYVDRIDKIISMGGNYKSHGNCSPVAEYNYWWDPHSVQEVFTRLETDVRFKNTKFYMIPLDLTRELVLTPNYIQLMKFLNEEVGSLIEKITKFYIDFHWEYEKIIGCVINDIAVPIFLTNPKIYEGFSSFVSMITEGEAVGQTIVDRYSFLKKESNVIILNKVNREELFLEFISVLTGAKKEIIKKYL